VWKSQAAGLEVIAHPALVPEADGVAIRLLDYPGEAALVHEAGLVALAIKQASQLIKSLRKSLLAGNELTLVFAALEVDRKQAGRGYYCGGGPSAPARCRPTA
jgi:ATP-dependent helicase HrpA